MLHSVTCYLLFFCLQTCRLPSPWFGRSKCILRGHDPSTPWAGQTGPRSCKATRNVPFVFILAHIFSPEHLICFNAKEYADKKTLHKTDYLTVTKPATAVTEIVLFFVLFFEIDVLQVSCKCDYFEDLYMNIYFCHHPHEHVFIICTWHTIYFQFPRLVHKELVSLKENNNNVDD